jgi:hypothetical protein
MCHGPDVPPLVEAHDLLLARLGRPTDETHAKQC